jgi:hypothetical protein
LTLANPTPLFLTQSVNYPQQENFFEFWREKFLFLKILAKKICIPPKSTLAIPNPQKLAKSVNYPRQENYFDFRKF